MGNIELLEILEITLMNEMEEELLASRLVLISPASVSLNPGHCNDISVNSIF